MSTQFLQLILRQRKHICSYVFTRSQRAAIKSKTWKRICLLCLTWSYENQQWFRFSSLSREKYVLIETSVLYIYNPLCVSVAFRHSHTNYAVANYQEIIKHGTRTSFSQCTIYIQEFFLSTLNFSFKKSFVHVI